ncbi:MAG: response regulator [Anaerolineaceae bacterium]|nr:response regulator [Anaerolineaceae bacterium]
MQEKTQNPTILIADDNAVVREMLGELLESPGYHIIYADNGENAVSKAIEVVPDLVLLDVMMPKLNGFEVCEQLRAHPLLAEVPILMVTALDDRDSRVRGIKAGADDFITKPFYGEELQARVKTVIRLNRYRGLLDERAKLEKLNLELATAYDATIKGWARALELRDQETEGHSQRVVAMSLHLAQMYGIVNADQLTDLRRGAILHDVGKMGVPDGIFLKETTLDHDEWEIMRKHPVYGYDMLKPIEYLRPALDVVLFHHEHWDGSGYPEGLKGEEIPLYARIFAIPDVWDALRNVRPYKPAWDRDVVIDLIRNESGKHFDPAIVEVFLEAIQHRGIWE